MTGRKQVNQSLRFQCVNLQIEALCDRRKIKVAEDVPRALQLAPPGLMEMYRVTYDQVENLERSGQSIATNIFKWLLCAQRTLSQSEVLAIISGDEDINGLADTNKVTIDLILSCCCTLVMFDEEANVLRFAHPSVREYGYMSRDVITC